MSLLPILDEIDHVQRLLEDEFPSAGQHFKITWVFGVSRGRIPVWTPDQGSWDSWGRRC
jgi:hypothetical protein